MIYFTVGLFVILLVGALMFISKYYGKVKAELKVSNTNAEALREYGKIDNDYRNTDADTLRKRMRKKVRKHTP